MFHSLHFKGCIFYEGSSSLVCKILERFSLKLRKTTAPVITPANHSRAGQSSELIRTRSKYMLPSANRGKTRANKLRLIFFSDWLRKWRENFLKNSPNGQRKTFGRVSSVWERENYWSSEFFCSTRIPFPIVEL